MKVQVTFEVDGEVEDVFTEDIRAYFSEVYSENSVYDVNGKSGTIYIEEIEFV